MSGFVNQSVTDHLFSNLDALSAGNWPTAQSCTQGRISIFIYFPLMHAQRHIRAQRWRQTKYRAAGKKDSFVQNTLNPKHNYKKVVIYFRYDS